MRPRCSRRHPFLLATLACALSLALTGCGGGSSPAAPTPQPAPTPAPAPTPTPPPSQAFVLDGQWERFSSTFTDLDGMVIAVNGASTEAAIVTTPANVYQFRSGDVKWRNIVRQSDTTFAFEDLVRQANSGTASYVAGTIEMQANRTELRLQFPTTGTFQQWRKR